MNIEIINTGSELMLGQVLNTHHAWLCRRLADHGYLVRRQTSIPDTSGAIESGLREAIGRADLVICTGGLGPTADDLTRQAVANVAGRRLVEDASVVQHIEDWVASRNRPVPPAARSQALVPEGARLLPNANGTAPGLLIEVLQRRARVPSRSAWLVMLPGPPRELKPMFDTQVLPWIARTFEPPEPFVCHTIRSIGIPESAMQALLISPLAPFTAAGLELGYCARPGEVDVRLAARGSEAARLVAEAEAVVLGLVGGHAYGTGDQQIEEVVVRALTTRKETVATAESCTGGLLASRITDVPGASAVFLGGVVAYSNEVKESLLGVRAETLEAYGAVSKPVAQEMAERTREKMGADYALATTGIAGPSGGTLSKPVGTVFIALASGRDTTVLQRLNSFDRETFKRVATQQALDLLRGTLRV